ncbi:MAG: hypothetical protein MH825_16370 [Cyanobacteria bacterium]|nr:hypothetical protein [Cyanobacteriota bacterium]
MSVMTPFCCALPARSRPPTHRRCPGQRPPPFAPMSTVHPQLQQVVQQLEADRNVTRIKKLLLLACTGHWESDNQKIDLLDTGRLVKRMRSLCPTHDRLTYTLHQAAANLNKPSVYGVIATELCNLFTAFYPAATPPKVRPPDTFPTVFSAAPPSAPGGEATALAMPEAPSPPSGPPDGDPPHPTFNTPLLPKPLSAYDWFSVRLDIMRAANPLRVKILSFFTLEPQTSFNAYTWASIKAEMLDRLLYRLCETFTTIEELTEHINATVKRFPEVEEYAQTADAMLRALDRLIYSADPGAEDNESFGATGQFPGFELFQPSDDQSTVAMAEGEEDGGVGVERSLFAVENAFTRP